MHTITYVVIAVMAIAVGLWLATHVEKIREWMKVEKSIIQTPSLPKHVEPILASAPLENPISALLGDKTQNRLRDRLREQKAVGASLNSSLSSVMAEFGDRVSMDDAIQSALRIGYAPTDIASFMTQRQYQPQEIARLLVGENVFSINELGDILIPLVKGDTISVRVEKTFQAIKESIDVEDNIEDLIQLPAHLECSSEEGASIVYRNTDMNLGAVVRELKLYTSPDVVVRLAKSLDIDLSEDDEYKALREEHEVEFDAVATILKACGKDAETIITAENDDSELSGDELEIVFSALSKAGFTNTEIMTGISEAGILNDNVCGTIIQAAFKSKVSMEDVVSFLKKEDVDPDEFDEEMRTLEIGILTRVDVLHALLHFVAKPLEVKEHA